MQRELPRWVYPVLCIILVVGNIYVCQQIFAPPVLRVDIFKVGKGHSILIQSPAGRAVLVDAADASVLRGLGTALPVWQRHLDATIVTSTKKTFSGGMPDVESRYDVTRSFTSGTDFSFDNISLSILAPGTLTISYGSAVFNISSSTPSGAYVSDGRTVTQTK